MKKCSGPDVEQLMHSPTSP